jgi:hypothetical protein
MQCGSAVGVVMAFVVTPMELVKAKLQVQYNSPGQRALYAGPIDCVRQLFACAWHSWPLHRSLSDHVASWFQLGLLWRLPRRQAVARLGSRPPTRRRFPPTCACCTRSPPARLLALRFGSPAIRSMSSRTRCRHRRTAPTVAPRSASRQSIRRGDCVALVVALCHAYLRSLPANSAAFLAFEVAMSILPA